MLGCSLVWGSARGHAERAALLVGLLWSWLSFAAVAGAAPLTLPFGWSDGDGAAVQARERANAWANAWRGRVDQVMSTAADDDFVETLAMIESEVPLPEGVLDELPSARPWLAERLTMALGPGASLDPESVQLLERDADGVAVLRGRGRAGDTVVWVAVGPRGPRHVVVVMQVAAGEQVLYAAIFDAAIDELSGLRPPATPFPSGTVHVVAWLAWLALGLGGAITWIRRNLPRSGVRAASRQVAAVLGGAALLVLVAARLALGGSAVELSLVDSTPWVFALQLAMGGPVIALLVIAAAELIERQPTLVASAPPQGSFANSGSPRAVGHVPAQPVARASDPALDLAHAQTGDTQVGPAPTLPPVPPAVTGDTQVGRAPAVRGNTQVGPPPAAPHDDMSSPPVREVIAGAIEVDTQVGPRPPRPPLYEGVTDDTTARRHIVVELDEDVDEDAPASLIDAHED
ncbi:MAG: hypothetical protein AB1Z98_22180 [Nannocystaceae bacterium]